MTSFDCIIVGGGPAGLSAAIYLGRFKRSVLVIDNHHGRSTYPQINEDYLGFPDGIHALKLRQLGQIQAEKFGAKFVKDTAHDIKLIQEQASRLFEIKGTNQLYQAKTVILATGVTDILPVFNECEQYFGYSIFWCITCDGYKALNKKIVIIGNNNEAASTTLQFLNYTKDITFVTNCSPEACKVPDHRIKLLDKYNIPVFNHKIKDILGENNQVQKIVLDDGTQIEANLIYSMQGSTPKNELALKLGAKVDQVGFIQIDADQRTSVPGIYAAGDITRPYSHQIVSAVHEGSIAAQAVNYDLYDKDQQD